MAWNGSFTCDFCGKDFRNNPIKLTLHIKNTHEKKFRKY